RLLARRGLAPSGCATGSPRRQTRDRRPRQKLQAPRLLAWSLGTPSEARVVTGFSSKLLTFESVESTILHLLALGAVGWMAAGRPQRHCFRRSALALLAFQFRCGIWPKMSIRSR